MSVESASESFSTGIAAKKFAIDAEKSSGTHKDSVRLLPDGNRLLAAKYRLEILSNESSSPMRIAYSLATLTDEDHTPGIWTKYMSASDLSEEDERKYSYKMMVVARNIATTQLPKDAPVKTDALGMARESYAVVIAQNLLPAHQDLADSFLREYARSWATSRFEESPEMLEKQKYNRLRRELGEHVIEPGEEVLLQRNLHLAR